MAHVTSMVSASTESIPGVPNPFISDPIPSCALAWNPSVSRPPTLPPKYDTRISPESIFFLPGEPDDQGSFVVPARCDRCVRLRQMCTRSRPACSRCEAVGHLCTTSDRRYVELPAPKVPRTAMPKTAKMVSHAGVGKQRKRGSRLRSASATVTTHTMLLRSRNATKDVPLETKTKGIKAKATALFTDKDASIRKSADAETTVAKKVKAKNVPRTQKLFAAKKKSTKKLRRSDWSRVQSIKARNAIQKISHTRKRAVAAEKNASLRAAYNPNECDAQGMIWSLVHPPMEITTHTETGGSSTQLSTPSPRIWASSKEELYDILPELKQAVNGILWKCTPTPVIFIEGNAWPQDSWNGGKVIEFTMVRDYYCTSSSPAVSAASADSPMAHDSPNALFDTATDPTLSAYSLECLASDLRHPATSSIDGFLPAPSLVSIFQQSSQNPCMPSDPLSTDLYRMPSSPQSEPVPLLPLLPTLAGMNKPFPGPVSSESSSPTPESSHPVPVPLQNGMFSRSYLPILEPCTCTRTKFSSVCTNCNSRIFDHYPDSVGTLHEGVAEASVHEEKLDGLMYPDFESESESEHNFDMMGISEVMNAQMGNQTQVNYANHDSVPNVGPSDGADADEAKICDAYHPILQKMPDSAVGSAADDMLTNSGLLPSQSHSRESYSTSLVPYNAEDVSMGRSIAQTSLETSPESIVVPAEGSVLHTDMAVRLHGDVSHGQAQIDGPQSYSLVPHVCETLPGDTRSTSNIPANGPPEIQAVINCHTSRTPVSIVLCADSSLLPFALPEQYGCVYLGFFNLTDVRIKSVPLIDESISRWAPRNISEAGRISWQFKLEWIPGGERIDPSVEPPLTPWWLPAQAAEEDNDDLATALPIYPYTLLPFHVLAANECSEVELENGISELTSSRGWLCTGCGKLNVQKNLRHQKCGQCGEGNRLPPVNAHCVRDVHGTAPVTYPWDRCTGCITYSKKGSDGMHTSWYKFGEEIVVKHLFTQNREDLQEEATQLFRDFQTDIELVGCRTSKGLSTGPYYTYLVGSGDANESAIPWTDVPECVSRARELIVRRGRANGEKTNFCVEQLTIIAWINPGSKKGCAFGAKTSCKTMLCLGANVELSISTKSYSGTMEAEKLIRPALAQEPTLARREADMTEVDDPMDPDNTDDTLLPVRSDLYHIEPEPALPVINISSTSTGKKGGGNVKKYISREAMFITLVHGDILILNGDDFEYSLKRTGMSIVLLGSN
ncbi:hypothetical protein AcW2_005345 [Taiwanofungus camphoratus]|nr:hypothetical protein AcW2_005345 [Antrodia cinnamomea]